MESVTYAYALRGLIRGVLSPPAQAGEGNLPLRVENNRERGQGMDKCEQCLESEITLTLEAYGNGQLMRIDCPKCGVSYDTNLDPTDYEEVSK